MSTKAILAGLRRHYPAPEWALLTEVRTATGDTEGLRIADVIAVSLWPSRGSRIHGIEIKLSRGDFLRERARPAKSAPFRALCSAWYLATPAPWKRLLLSRSELPDGWGLLEVGTGDPVVVVEAPERPRAELTPDFVLALLRAATRASEIVQLAPGVPVHAITRPHLARDLVGLACGHAAPRPLAKTMPSRVPCFGCAEGRPTDREIVLAAIEDASADDLGAFAEALTARGAA
jgi:hypothetical protein